MDILSTPINYLKGVGPARADLLRKELNILTYGDLLQYYPFRYIDKSKFHKISELIPDMPYIQIKGHVIKFEERGHKRRKRLIAHFKDLTGIVELVWFKGTRWIKSGLKLKKSNIK